MILFSVLLCASKMAEGHMAPAITNHNLFHVSVVTAAVMVAERESQTVRQEYGQSDPNRY